MTPAGPSGPATDWSGSSKPRKKHDLAERAQHRRSGESGWAVLLVQTGRIGQRVMASLDGGS